MPTPAHPALYQVNTRVWLRELSHTLGRPATLDDIPDRDLDELAGLGFDWLWLLGIWQTGSAGRVLSATHEPWLQGYREALPDLDEADICGSPFAIRSYTVASDFGGASALQRLRRRLSERRVRLLLDFVPNHTALDHAWVQERPEFYIQGSEANARREPQNYYWVKTSVGPLALAHGRDSPSSGWPDTLQLNYRHPALREAMRRELEKIAGMCDGVRCDMAMLILPDVFRRLWGDVSLPRSGGGLVDTPFWPETIDRVRRRFPDFQLMAEVYWDFEWELQQQGFDYTYDKRLYERLCARDAIAVRDHLRADREFQRRSVRFLENHDELRAAALLPLDVHKAAAVVMFLVLGLRLFHAGQLEGRRIKASVHLARRAEEASDPDLQAFYRCLLRCLRRPEVRSGAWRLLECRTAWENNPTWENFLSFDWQRDRARLLVAVNYSPSRGQCYLPLPFAARDQKFRLKDLTGAAVYDRNGSDLTSPGLYLDVPAWGFHVFEIQELE